jgi:hypothetical protein
MLHAFIRLVASGGCALASSGAFAEEAGLAGLGAGNLPCSQWSHVRRASDESAHVVIGALLGWVEGYVTAATIGSEIAAKKFPSMENGDTVALWIDGYCASHPTDTIAQVSGHYAARLEDH